MWGLRDLHPHKERICFSQLHLEIDSTGIDKYLFIVQEEVRTISTVSSNLNIVRPNRSFGMEPSSFHGNKEQIKLVRMNSIDKLIPAINFEDTNVDDQYFANLFRQTTDNTDIQTDYLDKLGAFHVEYFKGIIAMSTSKQVIGIQGKADNFQVQTDSCTYHF